MDLANEISGLNIDSNQQYFYGVRVGRLPGVYLTWESCREQVHRYPRCQYKKFTSSAEAEAWSSGYSEPSSSPNLFFEAEPVPYGMEASKYYYAVRKGHNPGIYRHHDLLKAQILQFSCPEHKKCRTLQEAREFMLGNQQAEIQTQPRVVRTGVFRVHEPELETEPEPESYIAVRKGKNPGIYVTRSLAERQSKGLRKRQTKTFSSMEDAVNYLHGYHFNTSKFHAVRGPRQKKVVFFDAKKAMEMMEDIPSADYEVFDSMVEANLWLKRKTCNYWVETKPKTHKIYVDGCCLGNGQEGARAGYGIHWPGKQDWYGPVTGKTNNAAELEAIRIALWKITEECAGDTFSLYTDSEYAINCITVWGDKWERNGWKNEAGKPVLNSKLIKRVRNKLKELVVRHYDDFHLIKVAGHAGISGNEMADALAKLGARGESSE